MADAATSQSARQALSELQLKARLLVEERDYYQALFTTSQRAFEDHRRELGFLEDKEREYSARREDALQAELAALNAANADLQTQIAAERGKATARFNSAFEQMRAQSLETEQSLRRELESAHTELLRVRKDRQVHEDDLSQVRGEVDGLAHRQEALKLKAQRSAEKNILTAATLSSATAAAAQESHRISPRRASASVGSSTGRVVVQVPFIPSGVASTTEKAVPTGTIATHNVHAMLQTVRKTTYRSPPRLREGAASATAPRDVGQLRAMTKSLTAELQELRAEYDSICHVLGDPSYASTGVSRKLRSLFDQIESKTRQLEAVRSSQTRLDAAFRMNRMVEESHRRDKECTELHDSLIEVVRGVS